MNHRYDFCILGAGIAGLSLADALQERSYSVIILEKNAIASGASGTPGGLVNPATGRKGKKTWKAERCYPAIRQNLEKVQKASPQPFFTKNGLLRPALSEKMARKMRNQFEQTKWPSGWCYWEDEAAIKERHQGINCVQGGLWLPIALTVNVGYYLQAYVRWLENKNVLIKKQVDPSVSRQKDGWFISTPDDTFSSEQLIFATGYAAVDHPWWNHLPLEGVKGQVARFRAPSEQLNFTHSISSMGYIARLGQADDFIQGSTYNHHFENLETDAEGANYLRERTRKVLPELANGAQLLDQWSGVRVNAPNRKPVLGRHPKVSNLHLFTGLGSKGLMYGKFLANHYADHLKNGTLLFSEVSIERFGE